MPISSLLQTGAISSAAVSFILKIAYDLRTEHQRRRAVAAALLGEISAYIRLVRAPDVIANLRAQADAPREKRVEWLKVHPVLPTGHPVFEGCRQNRLDIT